MTRDEMEKDTSKMSEEELDTLLYKLQDEITSHKKILERLQKRYRLLTGRSYTPFM